MRSSLFSLLCIGLFLTACGKAPEPPIQPLGGQQTVTVTRDTVSVRLSSGSSEAPPVDDLGTLLIQEGDWIVVKKGTNNAGESIPVEVIVRYRVANGYGNSVSISCTDYAPNSMEGPSPSAVDAGSDELVEFTIKPPGSVGASWTFGFTVTVSGSGTGSYSWRTTGIATVD